MAKSIFTDMPMTGICTLDIPQVLKQWNQKFWIAQWDGETETSYRIIRYRQLGRPTVTIKATISTEQAQELIDKLNLKPHKEFFNSATTWRQ